jgi:hypothetical protein
MPAWKARTPRSKVIKKVRNFMISSRSNSGTSLRVMIHTLLCFLLQAGLLCGAGGRLADRDDPPNFNLSGARSGTLG